MKMKKAFIISTLVWGSMAIKAQVTPPPTVIPPPSTPPPTAGVPLDPFSWLMLGAGSAAAVRKYYKKK
jgi:hypothetical protein